MLVRLMNRLTDATSTKNAAVPEEPEEPTHQECPFCLTQIPCAATRCPACTSHIEEKTDSDADA